MATARVSDRPEASAQAATSTCVHVDHTGGLARRSLERLWKDSQVPKPRLGGLSLFRARNTSSDERGGKRDDEREGQHSREVWLLFQTPLRSDFANCPVKSGKHVMCLSSPSGFPTEYIGKLAGPIRVWSVAVTGKPELPDKEGVQLSFLYERRGLIKFMF